MSGVLILLGNAILGGAETTVIRLARSLPRGQHRLHAMLPFDGEIGAALRGAGVAVHTTPMPADPRWRSVQRVVELVRRERIALIHAHLAPAHQLAAIAGRAARTPVLATIHTMHVSMADLEAHRLGGTHLCVVSEAARDHALAVGVAADRLHVVRNAVDGAVFGPRAGPASGDRVVIGHVGRLSPEKNPLLFVAIAGRLAPLLPHARFVVVGDGPLRDDAVALAQRLGVADRIEFRGVVAKMPALYRELDLLVLTSWHEGTPLAILEAMASGVPAVATEVGGVPELIEHGATGAMFPAGDEAAGVEAVLCIARDATLRRHMASRARERALSRFALDAHVASIVALWHDVAAVSPRRVAMRAIPDQASTRT